MAELYKALAGPTPVAPDPAIEAEKRRQQQAQQKAVGTPAQPNAAGGQIQHSQDIPSAPPTGARALSPSPSAPPPPAAAQAAPASAAMSPSAAAAAGLGWVPPDHPNYGKPGYVGSQPATTTPTGTTQPNGQIAPSTLPPAGQIPPLGGPPAPPTGGMEPRPGAQPGQPAGPPQTSQGQLSSMFRQTLMDQLGTNPNAISIKDADLAPQSEAFRAATDRDLAQARIAAAEEAGAAGLAGSGAARARQDALTERSAFANAQADASLIGQKQQQRLDSLKSAQAMAMQMGLAQEANDLQRQITNLQNQTTVRGQDVQMKLGQLDADTKTNLANMDATLQREGYSTQERIARMDAEMKKLGIDTQGRLGQGQLSLDFLRTQLQNQQFNDELGFNIGKTAADLNRDYTLAALRG